MDYEYKYNKYKVKYINLCDTFIIQNGGKKLKKIKKIKFITDKMNIDIKYTENLSEPWFSLITLGLKTIEGRKNKGRFKEMQIRDIIKWTNNDFVSRSIITKIIRKQEYNTFREYLESETLEKCLPAINNIEDGLSVYYKYFTKEDEKEYGVIAIELKLVK